MSEYVTPMIHVPDVRATVEWYEGIGFKAVNTYDNGTPDGLSFAILAFGNSQVMFNQGGEISTNRRDEQDLAVLSLHLLQTSLVTSIRSCSRTSSGSQPGWRARQPTTCGS